jgi:hypothetical protein
MKAVYPPAQVDSYDPSSSDTSPLATRRTRPTTKAASGPAVTVAVTPVILSHGVALAVVVPRGVVVAVAVVVVSEALPSRCMALWSRSLHCVLSWSQSSRHVWCRGHGRCTV